jgi:transcriptional regulator with XRE-family HTH domain
MEPTPNVALRTAIVAANVTQREIAARARIHEARFSGIARGRIVPSKDEQKRIARALRTSVDHLFPSSPDEAAVAS